MDTIKITGGRFKRRKLVTPGGGTHPMGERERIALFNMLGKDLKGAQVMDAYAGSGALGIEALSRGAKEVVFVEESHLAMRTVVMNCMTCGLKDEEVAFYRGAVGAYYRKFIKGAGFYVAPSIEAAMQDFPKKVDIIIADPPYDNFNNKEISRLAKDYLRDGGILALSHPDEEVKFPHFTILKTKKYAGAHITIYRKN